MAILYFKSSWKVILSCCCCSAFSDCFLPHGKLQFTDRKRCNSQQCGEINLHFPQVIHFKNTDNFQHDSLPRSMLQMPSDEKENVDLFQKISYVLDTSNCPFQNTQIATHRELQRSDAIRRPSLIHCAAVEESTITTNNVTVQEATSKGLFIESKFNKFQDHVTTTANDNTKLSVPNSIYDVSLDHSEPDLDYQIHSKSGPKNATVNNAASQRLFVHYTRKHSEHLSNLEDFDDSVDQISTKEFSFYSDTIKESIDSPGLMSSHSNSVQEDKTYHTFHDLYNRSDILPCNATISFLLRQYELPHSYEQISSERVHHTVGLSDSPSYGNTNNINFPLVGSTQVFSRRDRYKESITKVTHPGSPLKVTLRYKWKDVPPPKRDHKSFNNVGNRVKKALKYSKYFAKEKRQHKNPNETPKWRTLRNVKKVCLQKKKI